MYLLGVKGKYNFTLFSSILYLNVWMFSNVFPCLDFLPNLRLNFLPMPLLTSNMYFLHAWNNTIKISKCIPEFLTYLIQQIYLRLARQNSMITTQHHLTLMKVKICLQKYENSLHHQLLKKGSWLHLLAPWSDISKAMSSFSWLLAPEERSARTSMAFSGRFPTRGSKLWPGLQVLKESLARLWGKLWGLYLSSL